MFCSPQTELASLGLGPNQGCALARIAAGYNFGSGQCSADLIGVTYDMRLELAEIRADGEAK
jgi:hypothetical protein